MFRKGLFSQPSFSAPIRLGDAMATQKKLTKDELADAWTTLAENIEDVATTLSEKADPNTRHNKDFYVRLWAIALLCRTVNNFTGMRLLLADGLIVEARTLARCCHENLFRMGYLVKERQKAVDEWLSDWDRSRKATGKDLLDWSRRHSKDAAANDEFDKFMAKLDAKKFDRGLSLEGEAKAGGMGDAYIAYRMLSGDAAHPTAAVLYRHAREEPDGSLMISGPTLPSGANEDLDTIALGCKPLIFVCMGVNEILKLGQGSKLFKLNKEHSALERTTLSLGRAAGYSEEQIALKTDLTVEYVRGVIRLIENGEDRLLRAVESGAIPVSVAIQIAESDDGDIQEALQLAYESGDLKGKKITIARQLVEQRRRRGKTFGPGGRRSSGKLSPSSLIRTYQQDVERKRQMVRKAEATRDRLTFVVQALRTLFTDEGLLSLLRTEGLDTLPRNLASRLQGA